MHDVLILAIKGLAGGSLVVVFALLSQGLEPKRFAGLFSAAPAVALAGLTVTLLDKGPHDAHQSAAGMIAGAAGMAVYAAAVIPLLRRIRPAPASATALGVWTAVASGGVTLALSSAVWAAAVALGYVVLWWR
jgi:uncharacterized membrane protein (GlpM family)